MRIIILGASGQIGNIIFKELKRVSNYEVGGASRNPVNGLIKFDPFQDDWSLLGKVDVLINCVGQIKETNEFNFEKIHSGITKIIVEKRAILGNPRIIQVSALGASTDHYVKFLRTKGEADEFLLQFLNTIVVRPSIVCTHQTMLVKKMIMLLKLSRLTKRILFLPKDFIDHKIQPVMPEDLAGIIYTLCKVDDLPQIVNVTGPECISFRKLIRIMFEIRSAKYKIFEVPKKSSDIMVKFIVNPLFPGIINDQQYQLLFSDNVADNSMAEKYLGRSLSPTIDFWKNEFK